MMRVVASAWRSPDQQTPSYAITFLFTHPLKTRLCGHPRVSWMRTAASSQACFEVETLAYTASCARSLRTLQLTRMMRKLSMDAGTEQKLT
jgi:hypothetical protein